MSTEQQNERVDMHVLNALRYETLNHSDIAKTTGLDIDVVKQSVQRLIRQNYVEACPIGFILTELAEEVCFGEGN